jgi:hypothetical protein
MQARIIRTVMIAAIIVGAGVGAHAQKNKPPAMTGGPSDAVFADLTGASGDQIRSDGFITQECSSGMGGEASRYCGGTYTDPATGLTYGGVGPECSRISYGSNGQYAFRTISSKCPSYPPPGGGRRLTLDFSKHLSGACKNADLSDDVIQVTVDSVTKSLNVCGENRVDDVQIVADGMFTGSSATVIVYFSLHAPPASNVMQFVMEFTRPLSVGDLGSAKVLTSSGSAVLWRMSVGKGGKVQKAATPIGEYQMNFALTARMAPMPF